MPNIELMPLYPDRDDRQFEEWIILTLRNLREQEDNEWHSVKGAFNEADVPVSERDEVEEYFNKYRLLDHPFEYSRDVRARPSSDGLKSLNKLEEKHYSLYDKKYIPMVAMSLDAAMEFIFQQHRNRDMPVVWHKDTFGDECPENWQQARDYLIEMEIIKKKNTSTFQTNLSYEVRNCNTLQEAIEVKAKGKASPSGHSVTTGDASFVVIGTQTSEDFAFQPTINPPSAPIIADAKQGRIKRLIKFVAKNIIAVIIAAAIAGLIVAYFKNWFGWR